MGRIIANNWISLRFRQFWLVLAVLFLFVPSLWQLASNRGANDDQDPKITSLSPPQRLLLGERFDLNRSTTFELQALPGIGPKMAQRILEDRDTHGPFRFLDDLLRVPGIGRKKLEKIAPYVVVSGTENR
jgi:competence ComEA-like helix-hairpin-helix protein